MNARFCQLRRANPPGHSEPGYTPALGLLLWNAAGREHSRRFREQRMIRISTAAELTGEPTKGFKFRWREPVAARTSDGASPAPGRKRLAKQELAVTTCPRLAAS
jgi:hypothetical protein